MKKDQILASLVKEAKETEGNKLKSNDVLNSLKYSGLSDDDKKSIIHDLEDQGLLVTPKGFSSFSPLQKKLHRFINDELLPSLVDHGEATIKVSEEELKDVDTSEERPYILNRKGDLIKQACNNTNVTEHRRVARAKKLMEDARPETK